MSFPPEVYLIGAQKAGTTTLTYLLDQHPHVAVAQPKEPHFFTHNWDRGLDWYKRRFPDSSDTICLDASTSYSMAPVTRSTKRNRYWDKDYEDVPARVFSINPNAKFIYLLRDPVERSYSGYWHNVRMGTEREEFRVALSNSSYYLDVSDYYAQLLLWLDYFSLGSFFFVLFEDMKVFPERVARDCFRFLGVSEETPSVELDSVKNRGYQAGWVDRRINRLATTYPSLRNNIESVVPKSVVSLLNKVKNGSTPIPAMPDKDRRYLTEYFRESNENLEKLIGSPLDRWRR